MPSSTPHRCLGRRTEEKHLVEKIANSVESLIEIRIDTAFCGGFHFKTIIFVACGCGTMFFFFDVVFLHVFCTRIPLSRRRRRLDTSFPLRLFILLGCTLQSDINNFAKFKCHTVHHDHTNTNPINYYLDSRAFQKPMIICRAVYCFSHQTIYWQIEKGKPLKKFRFLCIQSLSFIPWRWIYNLRTRLIFIRNDFEMVAFNWTII